MTIRTTLKSAALSLVVVVATASSAFAATAWVEDTTKVRAQPHKWADTIGWAKEGKKVWVGQCHQGYCYIEQKKGKDGWVRKSDLAFKKAKKQNANVEFCFGGGNWNNNGFGHIEFCID